MERDEVAGAIHLEEGAAAWPDPTCRPVEVAVAALDEGVRYGAATEGTQGGDGTGRVHLEGGPASGRAEVRSRAVEVAVAGLEEAGAGRAALAEAFEGVQGGESAGAIDAEDGAEPDHA